MIVFNDIIIIEDTQMDNALDVRDNLIDELVRISEGNLILEDLRNEFDILDDEVMWWKHLKMMTKNIS